MLAAAATPKGAANGNAQLIALLHGVIGQRAVEVEDQAGAGAGLERRDLLDASDTEVDTSLLQLVRGIDQVDRQARRFIEAIAAHLEHPLAERQVHLQFAALTLAEVERRQCRIGQCLHGGQQQADSRHDA